MPRLASLEKAGFYEFPPNQLPAVASLFAPAKSGGKLLDPCAGEGQALDHLASAWNLTAFANELDTTRAAECQRRFGPTRAVQGDLFQLRATQGSFSLVWCNPPYTWELSGDEKRREFAMLKHSHKWVQPGGYMVWVVYSHHITTEAASFLTRHSRQVEVWRIPGLHLDEYTHVVVVAQVGQPLGDPSQTAIQLVQAQQANAFPELTVQPTPCYELPTPIERKVFIFAPKVISSAVALQAIQAGGAQAMNGFQLLITPEAKAEHITPIVRPRGGQLALILAAGMFNGLILDTEHGRAAVRSTVASVEKLVDGQDVDEENERSVEKEVYRTQPVVTITLLDEQGQHSDLSGDVALVDFIQCHKPALLAYLDEHFKPLYTFDYTPLKPILARAKGGKLYPTQKHVIAACHTALQTRKSVIVVGEPGVGKTVIGATLAATLQSQMQPGQVDIVTAPPHLVEKWEREFKEAVPGVCVRILKNVEDVRSLMEQAQVRKGTLTIGIVSREVAKLGEGWAVAVAYKKNHLARWPRGTQPPEGQENTRRMMTVEIPICPTCGATLYKDNTEEPASQSWLERIPRTCPVCHGALWSKIRTFSKGKRINGQPKNPRVPLAEYIAKRYPGRVFLYEADELHESKSSSTDQGEAMMILANAAQKVVGLTGTLYGGQASGLYAIEFLFNPHVRDRYPWSKGVNQWVRDMGCLEKVIEYRPQYDKTGTYSGKRRCENKPKEAPGCSPLLVQEIIDHCVFVSLSDLGKKMPEYREVPVPITPDPDVAMLYQQAKQTLGQYLFQCRMEGDASALGMYLQTLLCWPSAPYREESCIHRKRLDKDSDEFDERLVHTIPALDDARIYAKEQWLIDLVREKVAEGSGVAVFCRQTGTRDIQPRIEKLLKQHVPFAKPYILKSSVAADKRESILDKQVEMGTNVLICNPRLVQTGLDLLAFQKIVFFEDDYSLFVTAQASRRSWRLNQKEDAVCETFYPYYIGLMENQAVELIGRKQQAANLLYGEGGGGLSALSNDGGSLLAVLASEINADVNITDLRDLFSQHAHLVDPTESAWFAAEEMIIQVEPAVAELPVMATVNVFPIRPIADPTPEPMLVLKPVPVSPTRRRKAKSLLDVPDMVVPPQWGFAAQLTLFGDSTPPRKSSHPPQAPVPSVTRQLILFDMSAQYA
jgi:hypothetical protein